MTNNDIEGEKIGEDKYSEHWSLDGSTYVQVPKWVIQQVTLTAEKRGREVVVCAAVMAEDGSIYRGHRHGHAMQACRDEGKKLHTGIEQQGFITTYNRYVLREEARQLQEKAEIPSADKEGYRGKTLFSEDLYQPDKDVILETLTNLTKE